MKISTGKEQVEEIDGMDIITFKSESDMLEYTCLETSQLLKLKHALGEPEIKRTKEGKIIPTKTTDITKIKGWRKKLFCTDVNFGVKREEMSIKPEDDTSNVNRSTISNISGRLEEDSVKLNHGAENTVSPTNTEGNVSINNTADAENVNYPAEDDLTQLIRSILMFILEDDDKEDENCNEINKARIEVLKDVCDILKGSSHKKEYRQNMTVKQMIEEFCNVLFQCRKDYVISIISSIDSELIKNKTVQFSEKLPTNDMHCSEKHALLLKALKEVYKEIIEADKVCKDMLIEDGKGVFVSDKLNELIRKEIDDGNLNTNKDKIEYIILDNDEEENDDNEESIDELTEEDWKPVFLEEKNKLESVKITGKEFSVAKFKSSKAPVSLSNKSLKNPGLRKKSLDSQTGHVKSQNKKSLSKKSSCRAHFSLLSTCKNEEGVNIECNTGKIHIMTPCKEENNNHSSCFSEDKFKNMSLGTVLNVGYKRPLRRELITNLEILKKDPIKIDDRWANIAASAVSDKGNKPKIKRILVPAISNELLEIAKASTENILKMINIEDNVKEVVSNLVDYVVRKEYFEGLNIEYDPDIPQRTKETTVLTTPKKNKKSKMERELMRLTNVTVIDESEDSNTGSGCGKEYCIKGCICDSLNRRLPIRQCDKEDGSCKCQENYPLYYKKSYTLAKEESKWHQTIYRKNNDVTEICGDTAKSKREKKLPTRFRNNSVILGKELNRIDYSPHSISNWRTYNSANTKNQINKNGGKENSKLSNSKDRNIPLNESQNYHNNNKKTSKISPKKDRLDSSKSNKTHSLTNSKDELSNSSFDEKEAFRSSGDNISNGNDPERKDVTKKSKTIFDRKAYIWCSIHTKYNCGCKNNIYFTKSSLIGKGSSFQSITLRELAKNLFYSNGAYNFSNVHIYDRQEFSARTYGSIFNYALRNISITYKRKRKKEIEENILSNTNSLVKLKIPYSRVRSKRKLSEKVNLINNNNQTTKHNIRNIHDDIYQNDDMTEDDESNSNDILPENSVYNITVINKTYESLENDDHETEEKDEPSESESRPTTTKRKNESDLKYDWKEFPQHIANTNNTTFDLNTNAPNQKLEKKKYRIGPANFNNSLKSSTNIVKNINEQQFSNSIKEDTPAFSNSTSTPSTDCTASTAIEIPPPTCTEDSNGSTSQEESNIDKFGLLCLTEGFGYLPVKYYNYNKLILKDPIANINHNFKSVEAANVWLNRFFKSKLLFEDISVNLQWVIVKKGILKNIKPFDKTLLQHNSKVIDKNGCLIDKDKFNESCSRLLNSSSIRFRVNNKAGNIFIDRQNHKRSILEQSDQYDEPPSKLIKVENPSQPFGFPMKKIIKTIPLPLTPEQKHDEKSISNTVEPKLIPSSTSLMQTQTKQTFFRIDSSLNENISEGCFTRLISNNSVTFK